MIFYIEVFAIKIDIHYIVDLDIFYQQLLFNILNSYSYKVNKLNLMKIDSPSQLKLSF